MIFTNNNFLIYYKLNIKKKIIKIILIIKDIIKILIKKKNLKTNFFFENQLYLKKKFVIQKYY